MACSSLDIIIMYNNNSMNNNSSYTPMSPRISFSNDFVEAQDHIIRPARSASDPPPSSSSADFEFSVASSNYSTMSGADELFFKGRLLPIKMQQKTLRDELLVQEDDGEVPPRPPKSGGGGTRWKGLLGLKRATHIGSKSKGGGDHSHHPRGPVLDTVVEGKRSSFAQESGPASSACYQNFTGDDVE